jgi:acyl carrier protein
VTRDEVREKVVAIATKELGAATPAIDADLAQALDSVQRLTLVVAIEDAFEVAFEPDDDAVVHTLEDVVDVLIRRRSEG